MGILLTRLDPEVPVPGYAHADDAGVDLVTTRDLVLAPGERAVVGTGIAIALPAGYAAFVHPRSGLAAQVCLINHDLREPVVLYRMDRIAQLIVQPVERVAFREVSVLPDSCRGERGYGSTGITTRGQTRITEQGAW